MFNANDLVTSYVARIRLLVGDVTEFPLLEDGVYEYLYFNNDNNETLTAIDALESIITLLTVNPPDSAVGDYETATRRISEYEKTLDRLKEKVNQDNNKVKVTPMIARSDRTNWNDINTIYNKD